MSMFGPIGPALGSVAGGLIIVIAAWKLINIRHHGSLLKWCVLIGCTLFGGALAFGGAKAFVDPDPVAAVKVAPVVAPGPGQSPYAPAPQPAPSQPSPYGK